MDKNSELIEDCVMYGVSSCCGAKVYQPGTCSSCMEPCDTEDVPEEDEEVIED